MKIRGSLAILIVLVMFVVSCSKLEEGSLSSSSDKSTVTVTPVTDTSKTAGAGENSKVSTTTASTSSSDTSINVQYSPKGTSISLQDWCRSIVVPNLDATKGYITKIIGSEKKVMLGTEMDMCHYSTTNANASIQTDTWETQQGKYPNYKFQESSVGNALASNYLVLVKKEGTKKIRCEGFNLDITTADETQLICG